jgi:hypothetical protein
VVDGGLSASSATTGRIHLQSERLGEPQRFGRILGGDQRRLACANGANEVLNLQQQRLGGGNLHLIDLGVLLIRHATVRLIRRDVLLR